MSNLPNIFKHNSSTTSPLRDLMQMQRRIERMMEEPWSPGSFELQISPLQAPAFTPSCDIDETETHYLLGFDLPGVKKDDIKIDLADNVLTVSGVRLEEHVERNEQKYGSERVTERFRGSFQRAFEVPAGLKSEQIEAHYADGVLRLAVPKIEVAKTQQVKISDQKSGFWDKLVGHNKAEAKANGNARPSPTEQRASVKIV